MRSVDSFAEYNSRLRGFIAHSRRDNDEFNPLALDLFHLQFGEVEPYRRLCQVRGVRPDRISCWTEIPPVPTAAFKELELTSLPSGARAVVFHSSGTSGQRPSRHFHNADSLAVCEASLLLWFKNHLLPDADKIRFIILTPASALAPHSSLVHMLTTVQREFGSAESCFTGKTDETAAWLVDTDATRRSLREAIDAGEPVALVGTAFSFVHLLDQLAAARADFHLPAGSRAMETGGYKGRSRHLPRAELHGLIRQHLGIPASRIVCEYGMSELSSQAYDRVVSKPATATDEPTPSPSGGGEQAMGPAEPNPLLGGVRGGFIGTSRIQNKFAAFRDSTVQRVFRFPPWARVRMVSPETGREVAEGESGLIQVYDLANVRSVLAVQTEDLGIRRGEGFELLGRAALAEPRGCSLMNASLGQRTEPKTTKFARFGFAAHCTRSRISTTSRSCLFIC